MVIQIQFGGKDSIKKYLNCIDLKNKSLSKNTNADKVITLNLFYFGIPFCENDIYYNFKDKARDQESIKRNIILILSYP